MMIKQLTSIGFGLLVLFGCSSKDKRQDSVAEEDSGVIVAGGGGAPRGSSSSSDDAKIAFSLHEQSLGLAAANIDAMTLHVECLDYSNDVTQVASGSSLSTMSVEVMAGHENCQVIPIAMTLNGVAYQIITGDLGAAFGSFAVSSVEEFDPTSGHDPSLRLFVRLLDHDLPAELVDGASYSVEFGYSFVTSSSSTVSLAKSTLQASLVGVMAPDLVGADVRVKAKKVDVTLSCASAIVAGECSGDLLADYQYLLVPSTASSFEKAELDAMSGWAPLPTPSILGATFKLSDLVKPATSHWLLVIANVDAGSGDRSYTYFDILVPAL